MGSAEDPDRFKNLYGQVQNWSLAHDTNLFQCLEEFSRRIAARTESTEQHLRLASEECQKSRIHLQTCLNAFNMLSNTQFMESRVRDEDTQSAKKGESTPAVDVSKEQETPENKRLNELREAVSLTKNVLHSYFDVVEVNIDDSDDEDTSTNKRTFREPKDPYLRRALPYLIGSAEFNRDRYIGLKLQVEEEEIVPDEDVVLTANLDDVLVPAQNVIDAERAPSRRQTYAPGRESDRSSEDLRNDHVPAKAPPISRRDTTLISSSESEGEDDLFAARPVSASKAQSARMGNASRAPENDSPSFTPRSSSQSSIHSVPAAKPTSLFDAEEEDDLFSVPKPSVKPRTEKTEGLSKNDNKSPKPTPATKPPKAASLFEDENEGEGDDMLSASKPSTPNPFLSELSKKIGVPPALSQKPPKPVDSVEPEPVNVPQPTNAAKVAKPAKKPSLFDDDDGDDLFAVAPKSVPRPIQTSVPEEKEAVIHKPDLVPEKMPDMGKKPSTTKKGKPSIFDDEDEDDDISIKKTSGKQKPVANLETEPPAQPVLAAQKAQESIIDNNEKEDLFATNAKWKLPGLTNAPQSSSGNEVSTPVVPATPKITAGVSKEEPPPLPKTVQKTSNVFDEDSEDEDLFASSATAVPVPKAQVPLERTVDLDKSVKTEIEEAVPDSVEKKPSLRSKGVEKWKLPGLGLPAESKVKDDEEKPVEVSPKESTGDEKQDTPLNLSSQEDSSSFSSDSLRSTANDMRQSVSSRDQWKLTKDVAPVTAKQDQEVTKPKPSVTKSKSVFDEDEEEDDIFAKKTSVPSKTAESNVKKWKLPGLTPQNIVPVPELPPADVDQSTDTAPVQGQTFQRQLGNRKSADPDDNSSLVNEKPVTNRAVEVGEKLHATKSLDVAADDDTDFAEPKLEPLPKTAPAALYHPMKWKLPGVTDAALPSVEESVSEQPASEKSVVETMQAPPTPSTPVPVPRRRAAKPSPEQNQDEMKSRSTTPPKPENSLLLDKSEEKKGNDLKEGTTIPMIPEMTIDTSVEAKSGASPKPPPVAARRVAKKAQDYQAAASVTDTEEERVDRVVKNTSVPLSAVTNPLVENDSEVPVSNANAASLPDLTAPVPAEIIVPKEPTVDPLSSATAVEEIPKQKPEPKPAVFSFTMPERDSQLFSTPEPPPLSTSSSFSGSQTSLRERGGSLFLDEDSDEDLFGKSKLAKQKSVAKVTPHPAAKSEKNAVSVNPLSPLGNGEGDVPSVPKATKTGVFEKGLNKKPALFESDEEDLFESSASAAKAVQQTLAGQSSSAVGNSKKAATKASTRVTRPSLFDDDDDDLFKH